MTANGKHEKFMEIGAKRINNALKAIRLIGNLSNRSTYEYSDADVKKMIKALTDAVEQTEGRFTSPKEKSDFAF